MAYSTRNDALQEYDVGKYRDLRRRSHVGDGFDLHHIIQKQIGLELIPGYNEMDGVCVVLRASEHRKIPTLRSHEIRQKYQNNTPRFILADDIWRNRQANVIPNRILLEAIQLHRRLYPHIYEKPGQTSMRIGCGLDTIVDMIRDEIQDDQELRNKAQRCLTQGNQLYLLPNNLRQILANGSQSSSTTGQVSDVTGTYVIHREYDSKRKRDLTLTVRIEFVRSETRTETQGRTQVTTTTRYYRSILEWS